MRRAAKVDTTQRAIVRSLRDAGIGVCLTPVLRRGGVPDAVLGYRGYMCWAEFKSPGERQNEVQRQFAIDWPGPVIVMSDPAKAVSQFYTEWALSVMPRAFVMEKVRATRP